MNNKPRFHIMVLLFINENLGDFYLYHNGGIAPGTHFMVWSIDLPYATPGNDNRRIGGSGAIGDGTELVMP